MTFTLHVTFPLAPTHVPSQCIMRPKAKVTQIRFASYVYQKVTFDAW